MGRQPYLDGVQQELDSARTPLGIPVSAARAPRQCPAAQAGAGRRRGIGAVAAALVPVPSGRQADAGTVAGWVLAALIVGPAVAEAQNATGKPNIWGHKVEGERLTLGLGGISDPDGEPFTNIHRAWYRVNASNVETRIRGAIGNWYERCRRTWASGSRWR